MDEGSNQLQEPSGAEAYGLESLREKILQKIEEVQNTATLRKVWSILSEIPAEQKSLQLSQHATSIFEEYNDTLRKLAQ
jgi:hypothetical protein